MSDIETSSDSKPANRVSVMSPAGAESRLRAMASIGQLAGGVVHEINNMLMVLRGNLELVEDYGDVAELQQRVNAAMEASGEIAALAQRLNEFSRDDGSWPEPLDLNDVTRAASERIIEESPDTFELRHSLAPDLWTTSADPEKAETAVLELLRFVHAPSPEMALEISTANMTIPYGSEVRGGGEFVSVSVAGDSTAAVELTGSQFSNLRRRLIALGPAFGFARQSGGFVDADSNGAWAALYLPRDLET